MGTGTDTTESTGAELGQAEAGSGRYERVTAPPEGGFDLRVLLRATGGGAYSSGASPAEVRNATRSDVEILDEPAEIDGTPLDVAGFTDGIQAIRCVAWRARRPVNLAYCAAGTVLDRRNPVALAERLFVTASVADHDWVTQLPGGLPVLWASEQAPPEVPAALHDSVAGLRAHLEDRLTNELVASGTATPQRPLVVDGDLRSFARHRHGPAVVGVVKTHRTRWLDDESELWSLPERWRSSVFRIGEGAGVGVDRYSCYVRLRGGEDRPWNFGLIRLETVERDQLDGLAALAMSLRQGASAPDGRWDRQLSPIRAVEEWLAARRPIALRP